MFWMKRKRKATFVHRFSPGAAGAGFYCYEIFVLKVGIFKTCMVCLPLFQNKTILVMPNFTAVAVATIIPMIIGFIYYHPKVLGGAWMRANGFTMESMGNPPKPVLYLVALVLSFFLANFLSANVTGPGQDVAPDGHSYVTFGHGAAHGILISITVVLPILGTMSIFERRGWSWVFVNLGYWAVTLVCMAGLLSAWR